MSEDGEEADVSEAELRSLERLFRLAAPGPWRSFVEGRDHESGSSFIRTAGRDIECTGASDADYDLIAAARNALPRLIALVRTLRRATESAHDEGGEGR